MKRKQRAGRGDRKAVFIGVLCFSPRGWERGTEPGWSSPYANTAIMPDVIGANCHLKMIHSRAYRNNSFLACPKVRDRTLTRLIGSDRFRGRRWTQSVPTLLSLKSHVEENCSGGFYEASHYTPDKTWITFYLI